MQDTCRRREEEEAKEVPKAEWCSEKGEPPPLAPPPDGEGTGLEGTRSAAVDAGGVDDEDEDGNEDENEEGRRRTSLRVTTRCDREEWAFMSVHPTERFSRHLTCAAINMIGLQRSMRP